MASGDAHKDLILAKKKEYVRLKSIMMVPTYNTVQHEH